MRDSNLVIAANREFSKINQLVRESNIKTILLNSACLARCFSYKVSINAGCMLLRQKNSVQQGACARLFANL